MNRIIKQILGWFGANAWTKPTLIDKCLGPDSQSYVGSIPSMPKGAVGHLAMLDAYFDLLADLNPSTFCDIGANKGEAGRRALLTCPEVKVFAFEANPRIHAMYRDLNVGAGVNWINCAVADRPGSLSLFVPKVLSRALKGEALLAQRVVEQEDTGKSSLLKRDEDAEYDVVEVPSVALDDFLRDHAPDGRVALWIDVEGAASIVLLGAVETLARCDLIVVEVEGFAFWQQQALVTQVMDMLQLNGFAPILRDREYQDAQFNVVFVRKDAALADRQRRIGRAIDTRFSAPDEPGPLAPALSPATVPVLVPCFNNPTYCDQMLKQLQSLGFADVTFVDNGSFSEPMLDWLAQTANGGVRVERMQENLGPHRSIFTPDRLLRLPRWFCVTDPDLAFNPALPEDFLGTMAEAMQQHDICKAGFALNISNRRELRQEKFDIDGKSVHIWEWEQQFWQDRLDFTRGGDPVFLASVDTTFALYDRNTLQTNNLLRSLRIGGRFTAEHLPWLAQPTVSADEARIYRASQKFSYYLR